MFIFIFLCSCFLRDFLHSVLLNKNSSQIELFDPISYYYYLRLEMALQVIVLHINF